MTAKQFFKSTAFKCIAALLAVLLVCGIFLTVMNAFLEVTDGERLQRAVKNIYSGKDVTVYGLNDAVIDEKEKEPKSMIEEPVSMGSADVTDLYKIIYTENGKDVENYLVTATGKGGYQKGTVTCRIALSVDEGKVSKIVKVTVESNKNQSFIGKIKNKLLNSFTTDYTDGKEFKPTDGYFSTGATLSSSAIDNAVNGAVAYINSILNTQTEGEKLLEIIKPFYGEDISVYGLNDALITAESEEVLSIVEENAPFGKAEICGVYKVEYQDGGNGVTSYAVLSKGLDGFADGNVTCFVAIDVAGGSISKIKKVAIHAEENQSFIDEITNEHLESFTTDYTDGKEFTTEGGYISSGATWSSTALNNSVNGAIACVKAILAGGNN